MTSQTYSELRARDAAAARHQEAINRLTTVAMIRDEIYVAIDAELGQYPQYKDHGRDWDLGFVTRTIETKRGIAFRRGDVVLYHQRDEDPQAADLGLPRFVAYSVRNGTDTCMEKDQIEPLATTTFYRHRDGLVAFAS